MPILKALLLAPLVAALSVGAIYFGLVLTGSRPTPEAYAKMGEIFGIATGVLFPVLAIVFFARAKRDSAKKMKNGSR